MPDFRVHAASPSAEPTELVLSAEESHHLVVVNRARLGAVVVAFDGHGTEWTCELSGDRKAAAILRVRSRRLCPPRPYAITLGQSLPKGAGMDAIVRKATELGVVGIAPLESDRTQVHLAGDRSDRKVEKWQAAALEAAKQCGNAFLPEIQPLQKAVDLMASATGYDLKLIASLYPGAKSLKTLLAATRATRVTRADPVSPPLRILCLIGPEGDFSPAELSRALSVGFEPITLGPLVLRCETAAVYVLSILGYELQNT
jgi:16S rRNA (uracil1498-N3)-methyltransferase